MAIRYGLGAVRNVGVAAVQRLVEERQQNGVYKDIFDIIERLDASVVNRRQMEFLIKSGAFDSIHRNRRQLVDSLDVLISYNQSISEERHSNQVNLFAAVGDTTVSRVRPALVKTDDYPSIERLDHEFQAIGFYLSAHPLQGYGHLLKKSGVTTCVQFPLKIGNSYSSIKVAGIVTASKFKVSQKGRFAFITLSDETGIFEVSVFKEELLNQNRDLLNEGTLLLVTADAKMDESGPRLIAQGFQKLDQMLQQWKQQPTGIQNSAMEIAVRHQDALKLLQGRLGEPGTIGCKIRLRIHTLQGDALVDLPGLYQVSQTTAAELGSVEGIQLGAGSQAA
jgi:DNA polymerase-3 subunit alpha